MMGWDEIRECESIRRNARLFKQIQTNNEYLTIIDQIDESIEDSSFL